MFPTLPCPFFPTLLWLMRNLLQCFLIPSCLLTGSSIISTKLNGPNFLHWFAAIKTFLVSRDKVLYIEQIPPSVTDAKWLREWRCPRSFLALNFRGALDQCWCDSSPNCLCSLHICFWYLGWSTESMNYVKTSSRWSKEIALSSSTTTLLRANGKNWASSSHILKPCQCGRCSRNNWKLSLSCLALMIVIALPSSGYCQVVTYPRWMYFFLACLGSPLLIMIRHSQIMMWLWPPPCAHLPLHLEGEVMVVWGLEMVGDPVSSEKIVFVISATGMVMPQTMLAKIWQAWLGETDLKGPFALYWRSSCLFLLRGCCS